MTITDKIRDAVSCCVQSLYTSSRNFTDHLIPIKVVTDPESIPGMLAAIILMNPQNTFLNDHFQTFFVVHILF